MPDLLNALILGLLQGLTEFLPISSSGHLVLAEHTLPGWRPPGVLFDALLHLGTLGSVIAYYRRELWDLIAGFFAGRPEDLRFVLALVVGSVPTAFIGLVFKDDFERMFTSTAAVGMFLLVTAGLLVAARFFWHRADKHDVGILDALWIGTLQGMAIAPGISRSGSTVTAALARRLDPALAARFSFFLSLPAIVGAVLLKSLEATASLPPLPVVATGMVGAFLSGWLAIGWFVGALVRGRFLYFAGYCVVVGVLAMVLGS